MKAVFKTLGTVAAVGFAAALVSSILYFMGLPVLDQNGMAWLIVLALSGCGTGVTGLICLAIWQSD